MRCLEIQHIQALIQKRGLSGFLDDTIATLQEDFGSWEGFDKRPRVAFDAVKAEGVVELMPIANQEYFAYKHVNGHPNNTQKGKLCVLAYGGLSKMDDGYPVLLAEMTLLTALRTAATAALAARYLARPESRTLAMIGNGAQSECLVLAHKQALPELREVRYYDTDALAMERLGKNLQAHSLDLVPCKSAEQAVSGAEIILTATAARKHACVLKDAWIPEGAHIGGIGGDFPGKTELDAMTLKRAKIIVEYLPQTAIEGEIQIFAPEAKKHVHAELWELVKGLKPARESKKEITLFDSVGFALEDFSILRLCRRLAADYGIGEELNLIPSLKDPRALFDLIAP